MSSIMNLPLNAAFAYLTKLRPLILKFMVLLLVFSLAAAPSNSTIILVTLTRHAIFIGADGRATFTDQAGNETYFDACKIRQFGKIAVAYAGTVSDPSVPFDVWATFNTIRASTVTEFADKAAKELAVGFQSLAQHDAQSGKITPKQIILGDVGIAGFEGKKVAYIRLLFVQEKGVIRTVTINEGGAFEKDLKINPQVIEEAPPIGRFDAIGLSDFVSMDCPQGTDLDKVVRCRLNAYIKVAPKHINEPLSIVKITESGISWVETGKCQLQK